MHSFDKVVSIERRARENTRITSSPRGVGVGSIGRCLQPSLTSIHNAFGFNNPARLRRPQPRSCFEDVTVRRSMRGVQAPDHYGLGAYFSEAGLGR